MQIEIIKRADGAGTLRCIRKNGSVTWRPSLQPLHDLTRYAVESFLEVKDGYWSRIAQGSSLTDADTPRSEPERSSLWLTQKFDVELAGAIAWRAAELGRELTEETMDGIRNERDQLFRRWFELLPGEPLLLEWT